MLYRNDDINKYTDLNTFIKIHDCFKQYRKIHTCVIEMDGLWDSKGIWYLLATEPYIEIGLHGWMHKDYSKMRKKEIIKNIEMSVEYWHRHILEGFGKVIPITTFYPPWNRISPELSSACSILGMKLDNRSQLPEVFNFHWWEFINGRNLERLIEQLKKP